MADPILKWAGGKRQIMSQIRDHWKEENISSYHEPFFGGGAVFFREAHEYAETINDLNSRLMNFYEVLKEDPDGLKTEFNRLTERKPSEPPNQDLDYAEVDEHDREIKNYYYQLRAIFNKRPNGKEFDKIREAAILLYLNRTCFNGLYRENRDGEFNVPIGQHKNLGLDQNATIEQASEALQGVRIFNEDFEYVLDEVEEGDLVYFDPPYDPNSSSSSFVEYTSESFGKDEQRRLKELAIDLDSRSVSVVISNAPSVREIYEEDDRTEGFYISDVGARRTINSDGDSRGEVGEVIITNIDPENRRKRDTNIPEFGD